MEQSVSVWVLGPSPLGLICKVVVLFFLFFVNLDTVFEKNEMSLEKKSIEPSLHFFPTERRRNSSLAFQGLSSHPASQVASQRTCDVSPQEQMAHGKTLFCHIFDNLKGSV